MNPALLVFDMQNKWLAPSQKVFPERHNVVSNVNRLMRHFRIQNQPVIIVTLENKSDGSTLSVHNKKVRNVSGSEEAGIIPDLFLSHEDQRVIKTRYSCFQGIDLLDFARKKSLTYFLLCGFQLSACILATALDAYQYDLQPLVVQDGVFDIHERDFLDITEYFKRAECLVQTKEWLKT